jgi:hypothetical protein
MPIDLNDPATRSRLEPILSRLNLAGQDLAQLMAGAPAAAPTPDRQVDVLQKVYGEISNYDRHYSTTRSALTALVVTVGLAASAEPIKALFDTSKQPPVCLNPRFDAIVQQALPFGITLLLFLLAVLVSLYFQRLTRSCQLLEEAIEREINRLTTGTVRGQPDRQLAPIIGNISYYQFREDLGIVGHSLKWPHFDTMSRLLLFGIFVFISFIIDVVLYRCSALHWYFGILILIGPGVVIWLLASLLNRRT